MPFWRRRARSRNRPRPGIEPMTSTTVEPSQWRARARPTRRAEPGRRRARRRRAEPPARAEPASEPEPGLIPRPRPTRPAADPPRARAGRRHARYAPFDPTAFLAVAPAHTLDQGLERTRGGFMTQLCAVSSGGRRRTRLGRRRGDAHRRRRRRGPAIDLVERARRRRDPGGAEAAIRAELAALLVAARPDWQPQPATRAARRSSSSSASTAPARPRRSASSPPGTRRGPRVILAAADTFRAAAIDQLRIWADRAGVPIVAHAPGADPGAVVYDALDAAIARGADLVIADTAGRLHTKSNLMDELTKIRRIIDKRCPAPSPRPCSSSTRRPARTGSPRPRPSTRRSASPASS